MVIGVADKPHRRHFLARLPSFPYRRRIGIMGGSFNPAHNGHLYVAEHARKSAGLAEVWWLVSPQNPLKALEGMAEFEQRLAYARSLAKPSWLRVLDLERSQKTVKTADTLRKLCQLCSHPQFFWIMGADNLSQFASWERPEQIANIMPILVMNRPGYIYRALGGAGAALLGRKNRLRVPRRLGHRKGSYYGHLKKTKQSGGKRRGWSFIHQTRNSISATSLRPHNPV